MKKIKITLISIFIFTSTFSYTQSSCPNDSVKKQVKYLNWSSFHIVHGYALSVLLDKDAEYLVTCTSKKVVKQLLREINNPSKCVAIHIVLSIALKKSENSLKHSFIYNKDSLVRNCYTYNNISWICDKDDNNCIIEQSEIEKAKNYWNSLLHKKRYPKSKIKV